MFDVAFSELIVIAVVALIVIGPEKLPKVARTLGALAGRMQRYVAQIKEEVNREVRFQELQQLQQEIQETTHKAQATLQEKAEALLRGDHNVNAPKNPQDNTKSESTSNDIGLDSQKPN